MTGRTKNILVASLAVVLTTVGAAAQVVPEFGSLPLYFEATSGQKTGAAQFLARSRDGQVLIAPTGARLTLRDNTTVQMQLLGASSQAQIHGDAELTGKINYLTGNDPAQWRTGIPTFSKVRVENLYPGINAVYYGNDRQLEYDFNLAAGVSPEIISLRFTGVQKISVTPQGELALHAGHGEIHQPKPVIYQTVAGTRQPINGGYKIVDAQTVAFAIGSYDHSLPLVIDPILSYSSYFGGTSGETAWAVAVNTNQNSIFVAGQTLSVKIGTNGYQTNYQGGTTVGDAFVAKFDQNFNLVYLTYIGGSGDDAALGLAVDQAGNAFIGGYTDSPNFPVTNSVTLSNVGVPGVTNHIGGSIYKYTSTYFLDGFVAELAANGASLIYSTYLGGSVEDAVESVAVDSADNLYVTGYTLSTNLPFKNPVSFIANGTTHVLNTLVCPYTFFNCNAFIAKIAPQGSGLNYLTYFGGTNFDVGKGIAADSSGNAYVTGYTLSTNFPIQNAFQPNLNQSSNLIGNADAFAVKLDPNGNLLYSTYLGNTNSDEGNAIAVDNSGAAYITGWTTSTNFYNTAKNIIGSGVTNNVNGVILTTNAFLTKITTGGGGLASVAYSAVFGGSVIDQGFGVAVDPAGNVFVAGTTASQNFPIVNSQGLLRYTNSGGNDAFVTAFNANCTKVLYSVYLGGSGADFGYGIAVDQNSTAYVVGQTASANFPVTTVSTNFPIYTAQQKTLSGPSDTFLAKILIAQYAPSFSIVATKTNKVTLTWPAYSEPEIGPYALQSTTNLATKTWLKVTNVPAFGNNTNVLTLPATNKYQFFRLTQ